MNGAYPVHVYRFACYLYSMTTTATYLNSAGFTTLASSLAPVIIDTPENENKHTLHDHQPYSALFLRRTYGARRWMLGNKDKDSDHGRRRVASCV